jgi:hypothetical protein
VISDNAGLGHQAERNVTVPEKKTRPRTCPLRANSADGRSIAFELQFEPGLQEAFKWLHSAVVEDAFQWLHSPETKDELNYLYYEARHNSQDPEAA